MKLDSLEAAKDEMKKRAEDDLYLAIVLKESGKVIGEIFSHPEGTDPEDEVMDTFSPCWMLKVDPSAIPWKTGYSNHSVFAPKL